MNKTTRTALCAALLLPLAAIAQFTNEDYEIETRFRRDRIAGAQALQREGDQALAAGNPEAALDKYVVALRAVALRGRLGFDYKRVRNGIEVTELTPDMPMIQAGLRIGDVLVRIRGEDAGRMREGRLNVIFMQQAGEEVRLAVARGGSTLEVAPRSAHAIWRVGVTDLTPQEDSLIASLRSKAARAAAAAKSPFQVPALARSHAERAQALAKTAKTADEYTDAADQYRIASLLAPRWADLYINHALFLEAIDDAIGARESLALYLEAVPDAADRDAVRQKHDALAAKAQEQRHWMAWDGFWGQVVNGRRTESGHNLRRAGKIVTVRNAQGFEFMRGTITDEFSIQAVQRYTPQNTGHLGPVIQRCFNGVLEISGTLRLSPDKRTMTMAFANDFDIDPRSCRMVRNNTVTLQYAK
jgi:tetratricopeptide (TPR) repeat protein